MTTLEIIAALLSTAAFALVAKTWLSAILARHGR